MAAASRTRRAPAAKLILGDCLAVLPTLADASVDAVVTDPPYGQTNEGYDGPVAFSPDVWRECHRVCKPDAALISFAGSPTYHKIAGAIEAAGWKVRQMWAWVYRDGLITSAWPREGFDRLTPAFDPIVFATKGKVLLNAEREGEQEWDRFTGRKVPFDMPRLSARSNGNQRCRQAVGRRPRTLLATDGIPGLDYFISPRASWRGDEKNGHPNQKPLALMRWLVSKLPPGGLILDPFAGSASTGKAALLEGFRFLGIERDAQYVEIARRRLRAARGAAR